MSSFITRIPIDLAAFKKLLPNGTDFESITFNAQTNEVEIRWGNRYIVTPFTYHVDFTEAMLKAKQLPSCAKLRADAVKVLNPTAFPQSQTPPMVPDPNTVDKKPRRGVKKGVA